MEFQTPTSYVVELMQLASNGDTCDCFDTETFRQAINLMDCSEINDFENITPYLKEHDLSAADVFCRPVTDETEDAFAAYLCYCINQ